MDLFSERVDAIYQHVIRGGGSASLERLARRQEALSKQDLISVDEARLHDLNLLVSRAVADALPLCRQLGIPVRLRQATHLPAVRLLPEPIEYMLAGLIDLCLDDEAVLALGVSTRAEVDRVIIGIERRLIGSIGSVALWHDVPLNAHLELLVGAQTLRAMGGRLVARYRERELWARIEIPRIDCALQINDPELPEWLEMRKPIERSTGSVNQILA